MAKRVGIRELREDLSKIVRRVQRGEVIDVTDRGQPVARLVPAGLAGGPLADLIAAGQVIPAQERGPIPPALDVPAYVGTQEAIDIIRADR